MNGHEHGVYVYFNLAEFACPCGECGSDGSEMDPAYVRKLDELRHECGFPFIVTSGYRCPAYNARMSTTGEDGPHTTGRASDLALSGQRVFMLLMRVMRSGVMTGIGVHQRGEHSKRFVHLDDLLAPDHPRPRVWTY